MRADLELIQKWVEPNTRVLDLGCGDGTLLAHLKQHKNVLECGLEIDEGQITECLAKGINVLQQDIDRGLSNFESDSFDTVLLTQTIQAVQKPEQLVDEMLRLGKRCIVTFPNFAYWRYRLQLLFGGHMPKSEGLPYEWYNSPNSHFCTIADFDELCRLKDIRILDRTVVDFDHRSSVLMNAWPNLFGINAIYHFSR